MTGVTASQRPVSEWKVLPDWPMVTGYGVPSATMVTVFRPVSRSFANAWTLYLSPLLNVAAGEPGTVDETVSMTGVCTTGRIVSVARVKVLSWLAAPPRASLTDSVTTMTDPPGTFDGRVTCSAALGQAVPNVARVTCVVAVASVVLVPCTFAVMVMFSSRPPPAMTTVSVSLLLA